MSKVDTTSEAYDEMAPIWQRCRDVIAGEDAVKRAGDTYLPQLSGQDSAEYEAYKTRAKFYNASARTHEGMTGMIFRRPAEVTVPEKIKGLTIDATMTGVSLSELATTVGNEVIAVGRIGVLVEYTRAPTDQLTEAQADEYGLRPYLTLYKAEAIIDYAKAGVDNKADVSMVRLMEKRTAKDPADEFATTTTEQIRVLDLDAEGYYRQRVFVKTETDGKTDWSETETIYPIMQGEKMRWIPFVFINPDNTEPKICKPPLLDLINLNLTHYRLAADYYHGLHFTALPTPVIIGQSTDSLTGVMRIGGSSAWILPNPEADAKFLEFTGAGLSEIRTEMGILRSEMATQGMRILAADPKGIESAETASIHRAGENSVLASIAGAIGSGLTTALRYLGEWAGLTEEQAEAECTVALGTDYLPKGASPQMFAEWTKAYLMQTISFPDYVAKLKQWELVEGNKTVEEIRAEIETTPPMGSEPGTGGI